MWMVKRVGNITGSGPKATFEARSDNPAAPGTSDSRHFGPVNAANSYVVVKTFLRRQTQLPPHL